MSKPTNFSLPQKVPGGVIVTVFFKTWPDALNWLRDQGQLGGNSSQEVVDAWEKDAIKDVTREARSLRKRISKWLRS